MGSITSRGDDWPPKPYKRHIVRNFLIDKIEDGGVKRIQVPVEDYVWVYPGAEIRNGGGAPDEPYNYDENASQGQETAIRRLEDS